MRWSRKIMNSAYDNPATLMPEISSMADLFSLIISGRRLYFSGINKDNPERLESSLLHGFDRKESMVNCP